MRVKINSFYLTSLTFPGATSSVYTPEQVLAKVEAALDAKTPGDKPNTWLVPLEPEGFFTPTVPLHSLDGDVVGKFVARRDGEQRFLEMSAPSVQHSPAPSVEAILYEVPLLEADWIRESNVAKAEGKPEPSPREFFEEGDHYYELVIVKAPANEPGGLSMMVRNQLGLIGGTPVIYSSEEWCQAVHFWLTHVKVG